jgi:hypothetical protein
MTTPDDGGPAFPTPEGTYFAVRGMSLRDYFAAHAMAAYIAESYAGARDTGHDGCLWDLSDVAAFAFDQAEAMLKERKYYEDGGKP